MVKPWRHPFPPQQACGCNASEKMAARCTTHACQHKAVGTTARIQRIVWPTPTRPPGAAGSTCRTRGAQRKEPCPPQRHASPPNTGRPTWPTPSLGMLVNPLGGRGPAAMPTLLWSILVGPRPTPALPLTAQLGLQVANQVELASQALDLNASVCSPTVGYAIGTRRGGPHPWR